MSETKTKLKKQLTYPCILIIFLVAFSIFFAIFLANNGIAESLTFSGITIILSSRPACIANDFSTP